MVMQHALIVPQYSREVISHFDKSRKAEILLGLAIPETCRPIPATIPDTTDDILPTESLALFFTSLQGYRVWCQCVVHINGRGTSSGTPSPAEDHSSAPLLSLSPPPEGHVEWHSSTTTSGTYFNRK